MSQSILYNRIRGLLRRHPHLSIDTDIENCPCRLLWRNEVGQSGLLCKFYRPDLVRTVDQALRILTELRALQNQPSVAPKAKRIEPRIAEKLICCCHCGLQFPKGNRSEKRNNYCSVECREASKPQPAPKVDLLDVKAELIWAKYADQEAAYYS